MENFDLMAKDFDTNKRTDRAKVIADEIRRHILADEKSAMEFGCGTGLVGLQLADCFKTLLLLDSSVEMVHQVELKLERLNNPAISTLCCDLLNGAPQNLRADYIFSSLVLHHIVDTEAILRCFHSILNDEGHLLIVDIDKDDGSFHAKYPDFEGHDGFNHSALRSSTLSTGFSNVKIETFYHDSKTFNGKESPYSLFILDAIK